MLLHIELLSISVGIVALCQPEQLCQSITGFTAANLAVVTFWHLDYDKSRPMKLSLDSLLFALCVTAELQSCLKNVGSRRPFVESSKRFAW